MGWALEELLFFPFFANISFWSPSNSNFIANFNNPVSVPVIVGRGDSSLILFGDENFDKCEAKCSFSQWAHFLHFSLAPNGAMCSGNGKYCDCESALCIGDTVALQGSTGRYGNLQIPYSLPPHNGTLRNQWSWLGFCRDDFSEEAANATCKQMNFKLHEYSDVEVQKNGLESLLNEEEPETPFYLPYKVDCNGSEASLAQCKFTKRASPLTDCSGPVNIYCKNGAKTRLAYPSLTGSYDPDDSELLVFMNKIGQWSTVCAKNWTAQDNSLACEMAGRVDPFDRAQARSCWEHLVNYKLLDWKAHSGYYYVYSELLERVIMVHCDMEIDAGGWTLVLTANYANESLANWTTTTITQNNFYDPDPEKDFSMLRLADSFQVGNNPEFLITVQGRDGKASMLQVQYPEEYSMVKNTQEREGLVLVNQFGFEFDTKSDQYSGFELGMPWIYVPETGEKTAFYTMQHELDGDRSQPQSIMTTNQVDVSTTEKSDFVDELLISEDETVVLSTDSGLSCSRIHSAKDGKTAGIIVANKPEDRVFNNNILGGRVRVYVRTKNYQIKEAPLVDCKFMDYLLDGNRFLENASFTSSSLLVNDPAVRKEPYYNLNAHNSFITEVFNATHGGGGWVASPDDKKQWISVDLLTPHKLKAVITSGAEVVLNRTNQIKQNTWISQFMLETTPDKVGYREATTTLITDSSGSSKFETKTGAKNITSSKFSLKDNVRFVRLYPFATDTDVENSYRRLQVSEDKNASSFRETFGLRWELIGCSKKPRSQDRYILDDLQDDALGITGTGLDYRMGAPAEKIWWKNSCVGEQFQIRFPEMYLIKAIVLAGHPNYPEKVVEKFRIMFSKSGSEENLRWYGNSMDASNPPDQDEPRGFTGPEDGANPIFITFEYPWTARLVRFVVQEASANPCFIRLEFFGRPLRDSCMIPLGMESGEIADFQLNSSSQFFPPNSNSSYGPERARYDGRTDSRGYGAWRPNSNDKNPWISVNFRQKVQINSVILQSYELSFVETFNLMQSEDDDIWRDYKLSVSKLKQERMIEEIGTYTIYYLSPPIYTRHLRLYPLTFNSWGVQEPLFNIKFELLGCKVPEEAHDHVPQFSNFRHQQLFPNKHNDSFWPNQTNIECAKKCLKESGFVCRGFYYNVVDRMCSLTAANQNSWDIKGHKTVIGTNFYERDLNCSKNLGLMNSNVIFDRKFTASSNENDAKSARLLQRADGFYKKGWRANESDRQPWLEVAFNRTVRLTGLHINGDGKENHVLTFNLRTRHENETNWRNCCGDGHHAGQNQELNGNNQSVMAQTTWLPIPFVMDGQYFRIYPLTTFIQNTPAAFQIELIGCEVPNEEPKNPMAFATMKCTGLEERMEDCNVTASDPTDKFCNLDTAVRPKCLAHCGDPGLRACSTRSGLNFFYPHTVNFTCLNGNVQHMKCEANGFWSSPGVSCVNEIPENVAYQKNSYQSSTSNEPSLQVESKAVDGDDEKDLRTCSFTKIEMNPWWYVDLQHIYEIFQIEITPGFGFQNVEIRVGIKNPTSDDGKINLKINPNCWMTSVNEILFNSKINIKCLNMPAFGQYVSIQMPSNVPVALSLCEVKVIAKPCTTGDSEDQAQKSSTALSSYSDGQSSISTTISEAFEDQKTSVRVTENTEICKRTLVEMNPHWIIIPGGQLYVTSITLDKANDEAGELHDFEILVGEYSRKEDFKKNALCFHQKGKFKTVETNGKKNNTVNCIKPLFGSYVVIRIHSNFPSILSLCDVKIWGRICHTVLDGTMMHPLTASSYPPGSDIWVLQADEFSCFHTQPEVAPWVALDMIFPTEMYKANFTLCEHLVSGFLEIRVGDNKIVSMNALMMEVPVTSEESKTKYHVVTNAWPVPSGRYFSIHLKSFPNEKLQILCICNLTIIRDRYCPKEFYHNVAFGLFPFASTSEPLQDRIELTTDGNRQILRHFCFSTKTELKPYWILQLPGPRKIFTFRFTGRQNSKREIRIGTSTDWRKNPICGAIDNFSETVKSYILSCVNAAGDAIFGSVVSIEVVDLIPIPLYICEVEVWGYREESESPIRA